MNKTQTPAVESGSGVCLCGCGDIVGKTGKSLYKPGHDARHVGNIAREVAESGDDARIGTLPTPALRNKAENMVLRLRAKVQAQADRDAAKLAKRLNSGKGGQQAEDIEPVKVGRWEYPARKVGEQVFRNAKRDGSGSWIPLS